MHPKFTEEVEKAVKNSKYKYRKDLPDGRVRFYKKYEPPKDGNPNIRTNGGSNNVKEVCPKTGNTRTWTESYQKSSEARPKEPRGGAPQNDLHVVQVRPQNKNGVEIRSQHYPATDKELKKFQDGEIPKLNTNPDLLNKK
ncbi:hypothetical protein HCUR_00180 [Holospora curviuscula]|uniref:Uncharacterized protein n=1 Tax=Holospora curviuscula TaxID=1082868 RepID=A0A2S5REP4_9PROT|nr:hypothetical protein HCUR_00180 [Holospora curviuscula]